MKIELAASCCSKTWFCTCVFYDTLLLIQKIFKTFWIVLKGSIYVRSLYCIYFWCVYSNKNFWNTYLVQWSGFLKVFELTKITWKMTGVIYIMNGALMEQTVSKKLRIDIFKLGFRNKQKERAFWWQYTFNVWIQARKLRVQEKQGFAMVHDMKFENLVESGDHTFFWLFHVRIMDKPNRDMALAMGANNVSMGNRCRKREAEQSIAARTYAMRYQ